MTDRSVRIALLIPLIAAACDGKVVDDRPPNEVPPGPLSAEINRSVDVLFVVDDSGSMAEEQIALGEAMGAFESALQLVGGGRIDLHVGVVSTNMGAVDGLSQCGASGDDGRLLGADCTADGAPFVAARTGRDGLETNAVGDMGSTLACMTRLGTAGCGFESPLGALERSFAANADSGFFRDDAALMIVMLTDEDDCTAIDPALFSDPEADITSELGPLSSFRCFEHGVRCDPDDPRTFETKSGCTSRDGGLLAGTGTVAESLAGLKRSERLVVTGLFGPATPSVDGGYEAEVIPNPSEGPSANLPSVAASCSGDHGTGVPAIRLSAFVDRFALSGRRSICESDYAAPLSGFAGLLEEPLSLACVNERHVCQVTRSDSGATVSPCTGDADTGCFVERESSAACPGPAIQYRYAADDGVETAIAVDCE